MVGAVPRYLIPQTVSTDSSFRMFKMKCISQKRRISRRIFLLLKQIVNNNYFYDVPSYN
jgi:hypothetical protein